MFQVVMPLINLPLITHLSMCDAVGRINLYGYHKALCDVKNCLAIQIFWRDHVQCINHCMFVIHRDCFRCCTYSFSFHDLEVVLWSKQFHVSSVRFLLINVPESMEGSSLQYWTHDQELVWECSILIPQFVCLVFNCDQSCFFVLAAKPSF